MPDVFRVPRSGCERLHGQQMFGRGGEDAKARVVEHPGGRRVSVRCDIGTGLLVQPPAGQAELGGYGQCFLKDDAVRFEEGINVPGSPASRMRGPSQRRRICRCLPPRRAWQAGRRGGGRPPRCPRGQAVERDRSRRVDLVVGDEHAPPAERGRGMHERLRARPAYRTGTRSAAAREMPTTQARPRRLAWPGVRPVLQRAHPSAHRRSLPAHLRAAGNASVSAPGDIPSGTRPPAAIACRSLAQPRPSGQAQRGLSAGNSQRQGSERCPSHTPSQGRAL